MILRVKGVTTKLVGSVVFGVSDTFLMAAPYRACAGLRPPAAVEATPPHEEGNMKFRHTVYVGCMLFGTNFQMGAE